MDFEIFCINSLPSLNFKTFSAVATANTIAKIEPARVKNAAYSLKKLSIIDRPFFVKILPNLIFRYFTPLKCECQGEKTN
jgi:hypothetical protein